MKKRIYAFSALVLVSILLSANTQAEIAVPKPDKKPGQHGYPMPSKKPTGQSSHTAETNDGHFNHSFPYPAKKPEQDNVISYEAVDPSAPLSKQQAEIYNRIFAFQAHGDMNKADEELKNIRDERLLGHVLFQRYMHPTAYKTSFEELKYWLDMYGDHPGADRIYKLATSRKPSNFSGVIKEPDDQFSPRTVREPTVIRAKYYRSTIKRNTSQKNEVKQLTRAIRQHLRKGSPSYALKLLENHSAKKYLDSVELSRLHGRIAAGYFYAGHSQKAVNLAAKAVKQSDQKAPFAAWVAGLSSWTQENYYQSAKYFAITAKSEYASGWEKSAAAFWAARSNMRTGNVKEVSKWLNISYQHPHTFYGLLAGRALGHSHEFNWDMPFFTKKYFNILNSDPKGRRAIALVAAGQSHLAEAELSSINSKGKPDLYNALLAYTGFANLPALGYRLGGLLSEDGEILNAALYPKSSWQPNNGFKVDSALVHAIMRQESRFNPNAENSYSGAVGLMQILPSTASYVSGKDFRGSARHKLKNPQINLDVGQKYLQYLLKNSNVNGDVIKLLVAYNAGPGNLQKWNKVIGDDTDPLLFIERIPAKETRDYVEHVLSNYWIYRLREEKETPSLDVLAQGEWPSYLELQKVEEYDIAIGN